MSVLKLLIIGKPISNSHYHDIGIRGSLVKFIVEIITVRTVIVHSNHAFAVILLSAPHEQILNKASLLLNVITCEVVSFKDFGHS